MNGGAGRQVNKKIGERVGGWVCELMNGGSNFYIYYFHCLHERKLNNKGKFSQCFINHHVKKKHGKCGCSCIHPPGVCCHLFESV